MMSDKEKLRLLRLYKAVLNRNHEARLEWQKQCDEGNRGNLLVQMLVGRHEHLILPPEPEYEPYPDISGLRCGARTRAGTACKITAIYSNGRCKFHGGLSTGAKTKGGRARQHEGYCAWLEKQRASKAGRKRTRKYVSDVARIGSLTLSEIGASEKDRVLQPVDGIGLRMSGRVLVAELPNGHSITVRLTTTSPQYGGARWWYFCPNCGKRKAILYFLDESLCCRQCAGLHYASQSK